MDPDFLVHTVSDLVRIPSVNPAFAADSAGESAVADYVENLFRDLGLETVRLEATAGRPSVVGTLRGGGGRSLMLNAHYDTVGVEGMERPFSGEVEDGRVWGRGSYDMKGALAACISVMRALVERAVSLPGDVHVAAVADEETESLGTREVLAAFRPDQAVVVEPTGLGICPAHKGFVWIDVTTRGRAAHGSRPDEGRDANLAMVLALSGFTSYADSLWARTGHPLLGPPSVHLGRLEGGEGASTYAAACRATVERRTLPGETPEEVLAELRTVVGTAADVRVTLARDPFEGSSHSPLVRALQVASERVSGEAAPLVGTGPWTDAALFAQAGIDTVVFGPSGGGAHAPTEWVEIDSLVTLARVLVDVCTGPMEPQAT